MGGGNEGKIVHVCSDISELLNKNKNRNINTAYVNLDVKYPMALKVAQKAKKHSMMT